MEVKKKKKITADIWNPLLIEKEINILNGLCMVLGGIFLVGLVFLVDLFL